MGTICRTCGDDGFADALVLCNVCKIFAEHQYCLEKRPSMLEIKHWACFDCKPRKVKRVERIVEDEPKEMIKGNRVLRKRKGNRRANLKKSANALLCKASQLGNSVATGSPSRDKRSLHGVNGSSNADGDHHASTPMEVEDCSYSPTNSMSLGSKSHTSDLVNMPGNDLGKTSGSQVTPIEGDDKFIINAHSMPSNLKCSRRSRRRLLLPEEDEGFNNDLATNSICDISLRTIVDAKSSLQSAVPSSPLNIQTDPMHHTDKQVGVRQKRKFASTEGDQFNEELVNSTNKIARKKASDVKENMWIQVVNHASTVLPNDSAQVFGRIQDILEKDATCNLSEHLSSTQTSDSFEVSNNLQMTSMACAYQNLDLHAKPIIDCIWRGCFFMYNIEYGPISAHISNKACEKVWRMAKMLPRVLQMKKMSRSEGWPRCFENSSPTDDNIALYFFVQNNWIDVAIRQLDEAIMKDLMFKVVLGGVELLVFSSLLLPKQNQTFQGKHYFWGVFKKRDHQESINEEISSIRPMEISSESTRGNWNARHIDETNGKVVGVDSEISSMDGESDIDSNPSPIVEEVKFDSAIQNHHQLIDQHHDLGMPITNKASKLVDVHRESFMNLGDGEVDNTNLGNGELVAQKLMKVNSSFSSLTSHSITNENMEEEFGLSTDKRIQANDKSVGCIEFSKLFEQHDTSHSITSANIEEGFGLSMVDKQTQTDNERVGFIVFSELFEGHEDSLATSDNKEIYTLFPLEAEGMAMKIRIDKSKPLDLDLRLGCSNFT